jgi:hypothetical protein
MLRLDLSAAVAVQSQAEKSKQQKTGMLAQ